MAGVRVTGVISPNSDSDVYPVIDPAYGVDGLRNVTGLTAMYNIPPLRRKVGMVVGVSGNPLPTYYVLTADTTNNVTTSANWGLFSATLSAGTGSVSGPSGASLYWYDENHTPPTTAPVATGAASIALGNAAQALSSDMFVYGDSAGYQSTGVSKSIFVGYNAGYQLTGASTSVFIGNQAGYQAVNSSNSTFIGNNTGKSASGSSVSVFIGYNIGASSRNVTNATLIGNDIGATGISNSVFVGAQAGNGANDAGNSIFLGSQAGISSINSSASVYIGPLAGYIATGASGSNFIGSNAGAEATLSYYSNFIGLQAGRYGKQSYNSNFIGVYAGYQASASTDSNFIGNNAGYNARSSINSNFIGYQAGYQASSITTTNFIGYNAGYQATGANYSILIGTNVGSALNRGSIGENNIIIGNNITLPPSSQNMINIGGVIFGVSANSGTISSTPSTAATLGGSVSIGTPSPNENAILELSSTTKGFLPPRMPGVSAVTLQTRFQLSGLSGPEGLVIYATSSASTAPFDNGRGLYHYDTKACRSGFSLTPSADACQSITAQTATQNSLGSPIRLGTGNSVYGRYGTYFFPSIQNLPSSSLPVYYSTGSDLGSLKDQTNSVINPTYILSAASLSLFWTNEFQQSTDGRLNKIGLSSNTGTEFVGFSKCIDIQVPGTYYIGIAADNYCKFKVDSVEYVNFSATSVDNFRKWNVFPFNFTSGLHVIEMLGSNDGNVTPMSFGAEIYYPTGATPFATLTGATGTGSTQANVIFSTAEYNNQYWDLGTTVGYSCPAGYSFNRCDGTPRCTKIENANLGTFEYVFNGLSFSALASNISASATTLYTGNGTLSGNRTVNISNNTLNFSSSTFPNTLVLSGGNVGIGLVNPTAELHISGNASTMPILKLEGLSSATGTDILVIDSSNRVHKTGLTNFSTAIANSVPTLYNSDGTISVDRLVTLAAQKKLAFQQNSFLGFVITGHANNDVSILINPYNTVPALSALTATSLNLSSALYIGANGGGLTIRDMGRGIPYVGDVSDPNTIINYNLVGVNSFGTFKTLTSPWGLRSYKDENPAKAGTIGLGGQLFTGTTNLYGASTAGTEFLGINISNSTPDATTVPYTLQAGFSLDKLAATHYSRNNYNNSYTANSRNDNGVASITSTFRSSCGIITTQFDSDAFAAQKFWWIDNRPWLASGFTSNTATWDSINSNMREISRGYASHEATVYTNRGSAGLIINLDERYYSDCGWQETFDSRTALTINTQYKLLCKNTGDDFSQIGFSGTLVGTSANTTGWIFTYTGTNTFNPTTGWTKGSVIVPTNSASTFYNGTYVRFTGFYNFEINRYYVIKQYRSGDDFSSINSVASTVISGTMNTTGCVFKANANGRPANWSNNSVIEGEYPFLSGNTNRASLYVSASETGDYVNRGVIQGTGPFLLYDVFDQRRAKRGLLVSAYVTADRPKSSNTILRQGELFYNTTLSRFEAFISSGVTNDNWIAITGTSFTATST